MKHEKLIQEQLGNLPKYSLNSNQQQRIIWKLKEAEFVSKKRIPFKPLIAIITSFVLFSILAFHEFDLQSLSRANQPESGLIKFTAQEGEVFNLSDTGSLVLGIPGEVAMLNFDQFVAEDRRRGAKLMIYYWGDPSKLVDKNYTIEAVNQDGLKITLSEGRLNSPLHSEDAHTLTSFEPFPTEGEWELSFYVETELHGAFTLDVLPPFPKTEHYTLASSPKEILIGKESLISIESTWVDKEGIEVTLVNKDGEVVSKDTFLKDGEFVDAFTNKPLYYFRGNLTFPEQGKWSLIIDGERTAVFEN